MISLLRDFIELDPELFIGGVEGFKLLLELVDVALLGEELVWGWVELHCLVRIIYCFFVMIIIDNKGLFQIPPKILVQIGNA